MKTTINLAHTIHNFEKTNLVTKKDGDDYKCKKCGLKGKRKTLSEFLEVSGKKLIIEKCTGETETPEAQPIETNPAPVTDDNFVDQAIEAIAVSNLDSAISLDNPSARDNFMMDLGVIKGLQFSETSLRFAKAVKLWKLSNNKIYKKLGIPNFRSLCEKIGLKPTTGRALLSQLEVFGQQGYKALLGTGLKLRDINFLSKAQPEVNKEGGKTTIKIGDETIPIDDKDAIERLIKNIEKEKKSLDEQIEKVNSEKEQLKNENIQLKDQLVGQVEPNKALEKSQQQCGELLEKVNNIIAQLVRINDKFPSLAQETAVLMQSSFLQFTTPPMDNEADFETPEETMSKL